MKKKIIDQFAPDQLRSKWDELVQLERRLSRGRKLHLLLQPIGVGLFAIHLFLCAINFFRCLGGDRLSDLFTSVQLFDTLTRQLPHHTIAGCLVFFLWFGLLIPLIVCAAIAVTVYLLDRRKPIEPRPLNGNRAQCAEALAHQAERVYTLRHAMHRRSTYPAAGVLTVLVALPSVFGLIRTAQSADPAVLSFALELCLLLVCLFVLYWVFAGLLEGFSLLLTLFYPVPGEWRLYRQHLELDAYWESIDPVEFARRNPDAEDVT